MNSFRLLGSIGGLLGALLISVHPRLATAEARRNVSGGVILTSSFNSENSEISRTARKLARTSFPALSQERLSNSAIKVTVRRKAKRKAFALFSRARNPCAAPSIKRLLRGSKNVVCEPDWQVHLTATPNDTLLSSMYPAGTTASGRIFLREAWDISTGSENNVVGIIDSGLDYNHLDLASNVWVNPNEISGNGVDDDGNGFIDDVHGYDFFNNDSNPIDDHSHGTAVSGTLGAVGNNARGVVGVNWKVKMIACKAFGSAGLGTVSAIVSCLNYLANLKRNFGIPIRVTNNSYGGFPHSSALYNAVAATRDEGMVFVAGAGNSAADTDTAPFYPASYDLDNIIVVAATDSTGALTSFSNFGAASVDIAAPGIGVMTTGPNNQYGLYQGTSIATPHVAGAVALVLAHHPGYSYLQAISAIRSSGTAMGGLTGKCITGAILNVARALEVPVEQPPVATATAEPSPTIIPGEPTPVFDPPPGGEGELDLSTARIDISMKKVKSKFLVSCKLKAKRNAIFEGLPDKAITLTIKGTGKPQSDTTSAAGSVSFSVRPPKGRTYNVRCSSTLTDPNATVSTVNSKFIALRK